MKVSSRYTKSLGIVFAAAVALLYLTDFGRLPFPATLDKSWIAVIEWAAVKRLQFGSDIIFSYGPLGYLISRANTPIIYWRALGVRFIFDVLLLVVLFVLSCRLRLIRRTCFVIAALLVARHDTQMVFMFVIVGAAWLAFVRDQPNRTLEIVAFALLGTALAVKGTYLFFTLVVVLLGILNLAWQRNFRRAIFGLSGFIIASLAVWMLAGQRLSGIPSYIIGSFEIARGYSEAMNIWPTTAMLVMGLTGFGFAGLQILIPLIRHRSNPAAWCISAILALALFEVWKLGFTRADGHIAHFFFYLIIAVLALPVFYSDWPGPTPGFAECLCVILAVICSASVIHTLKPQTTSGICYDAGRRIAASVVALTNPKEAYARFLAIDARESQPLALPLIKNAIGSSTVDVFGHEQAVAISNQLNYTPRPVFQGYAVHTAPLVRLNAEFYRSSRAPDYVIFKLQTIDGHAPSMDDAEALLVLAEDYHPVLTEKNYTLLKRNENAPAKFHLATTHSQQGALDQWIRIPESATWGELRVERTLLGKLMTFVFQIPPIWFEIEGEKGYKARHRLLFEPAANGFIINPIIRNERDFLDFAGDKHAGERTRAVRVLNANSAKWFIRPHASYRFAEIVDEKPTETSPIAP